MYHAWCCADCAVSVHVASDLWWRVEHFSDFDLSTLMLNNSTAGATNTNANMWHNTTMLTDYGDMLHWDSACRSVQWHARSIKVSKSRDFSIYCQLQPQGLAMRETARMCYREDTYTRSSHVSIARWLFSSPVRSDPISLHFPHFSVKNELKRRCCWSLFHWRSTKT
jgi:hypothetical protein